MWAIYDPNNLNNFTPSLASNLGLSDYVTQMAMSLSFFMFSIYAILFATLSDVFTAKKVLFFPRVYQYLD